MLELISIDIPKENLLFIIVLFLVLIMHLLPFKLQPLYGLEFKQMLISLYEMNLLSSMLSILFFKLILSSFNLLSSIGVFLITMFLNVRLFLCKIK